VQTFVSRTALGQGLGGQNGCVSIASLAFIAGPYGPPVEYGRFHTGWLTILNAQTTAATLLLLALCLYVSQSSDRQLRPDQASPRVQPRLPASMDVQ
jgi:hypothetical protein